MFGSKKSITDRVKDSLTDYLDDKFEDYRGQIALDLAKGLGALAGLVVIWSVVIISVLFLAIAVALLLGWAFSFFIKTVAYILSFLLVSIFLIALAAYIIKYKEKYIVTPVFELMSETLRTTLGVEETNKPSYTEEDIEPSLINDDIKTALSVNDSNPDSKQASVNTKTPLPSEKDDV